MVYIIKSNGTQRAARLPENGTRKLEFDDIIEALRGTTLKLEIKIVDIEKSSSDEQREKLINGENIAEEEKARHERREKEKLEQIERAKRDEKEKEKEIELEKARLIEQQKDQERIRERMRALNDLEKEKQREKERQEELKLKQKEEEEELKAAQKKKQQEEQLKLAQKEMEEEKAKLQKLLDEEEQIRLAQQLKQQEELKLKLAEEKEGREKESGKSPDQLQQHLAIATGTRLYDSPLTPIRKKLGRPKIVKGSLKINSEIQTYCIAVIDPEGKTAYIPYDLSKLQKITDMISEMKDSIEQQSEISKVKPTDIVFAKSEDDQLWYRAMVEEVNGDEVKVYFFDWGLYETLKPENLRYLSCPDLGWSSFPACGVKISFSDKSLELKDKFLEMTDTFNLKVDSYNDFNDTYTVTILGKV